MDDAKLEAGHWTRASLPYRLAKRWERRFFERADAIVSLTEAGVKAFPQLGYRIPETTLIEVIPTCADLTTFSPGPRDHALAATLGLGDARPVIGYVGTMSNWYLRAETLRYLARLVQALPGARLLVVTREDHDALRADAAAAGIPAGAMTLTRAAFSEMPAYLRLMDAGVFLIRPCFSKTGSAATKLAEFLGAGIPVIINDGVGDSGRIVRDHGVGLVLPEAADAAFDASLPDVRALLADPALRDRCVAVAHKLFNVADGVASYAALYRRLARSA